MSHFIYPKMVVTPDTNGAQLKGSKRQLEQIWDEEDEMKDLPFNAKTFFLLHGSILML